MKNFKYFTLGYGDNPDDPIYGLYHPIFDCFLIVASSLELAQKLTMLLSSRYNLHICCLTQAVNYTANLIDNDVCERWTLDNKKEIPIATSLQIKSIVNPNQLIPSTLSTKWDIDTEKEWSYLCIFWLKFINELQNINYYDVDQFLNNFLEIPGFDSIIDSINKFEQQVHQLLYLNHSVDETDTQILNLVNQNYLIKHTWEQFFKTRT